MSLGWTKHASKCIRCDQLLNGWNVWVVRMEGAESETSEFTTVWAKSQFATWSNRGSLQLKTKANTLLVWQCWLPQGSTLASLCCSHAGRSWFIFMPVEWLTWTNLCCSAATSHLSTPKRTHEESQPNISVTKLKAFPAHIRCHHFLHFPTYHQCFGQHSEAVGMI